MKVAKTLLALVLLSCASCGGGDGSSSSDETTTPSVPEVAGTYDITTNATTLTCSDGSSLTVAGNSGNTLITQDGNALQFGDTTTTSSDPSITIINNTGVTGTINQDGSYSLSGTITEENNTSGAEVTLTLDFSGQFTPAAISGTIKLDAILLNSDGSTAGTCNGTTTFSGDETFPAANTSLQIDSTIAESLL